MLFFCVIYVFHIFILLVPRSTSSTFILLKKKMASFTMTSSILGCPAITNQSLTVAAATQRRLVVVNAAARSVEGEEKVSGNNNDSNGRRNLMFAVAAASVCSAAGMAVAADEPKRGSPEAKKKYGPVCVTNPTARICRN